MLHLRSTATGEHRYGIGVQIGTLYFRTAADVCWFKRGSHVDTRSGAGGGTLMMKLDENNLLEIFGPTKISSDLTVGAGANGAVVARHFNGKQVNNDAVDHLYLNWGTGKDVVVGGAGVPSALEISGRVRALAAGQTSVDTVIKVITVDLDIQNGFDNSDPARPRGIPGTAPWTWSTELDEAYAVYATVSGFTMIGGPVINSDPPRSQTVEVIPQTVWTRVLPGWQNGTAVVEAFCAQSRADQEGNNFTRVTVVAVGRKLS